MSISNARLPQKKGVHIHHIDAFLPSKKEDVRRFLHDNKSANVATARAASTGEHKPFGRVADLRVTQDELRPGARGRIWHWDESGRCSHVPRRRTAPLPCRPVRCARVTLLAAPSSGGSGDRASARVRRRSCCSGAKRRKRSDREDGTPTRRRFPWSQKLVSHALR